MANYFIDIKPLKQYSRKVILDGFGILSSDLLKAEK